MTKIPHRYSTCYYELSECHNEVADPIETENIIK